MVNIEHLDRPEPRGAILPIDVEDVERLELVDSFVPEDEFDGTLNESDTSGVMILRGVFLDRTIHRPVTVLSDIHVVPEDGLQGAARMAVEEWHAIDFEQRSKGPSTKTTKSDDDEFVRITRYLPSADFVNTVRCGESGRGGGFILKETELTSLWAEIPSWAVSDAVRFGVWLLPSLPDLPNGSHWHDYFGFHQREARGSRSQFVEIAALAGRANVNLARDLGFDSLRHAYQAETPLKHQYAFAPLARDSKELLADNLAKIMDVLTDMPLEPEGTLKRLLELASYSFEREVQRIDLRPIHDQLGIHY